MTSREVPGGKGAHLTRGAPRPPEPGPRPSPPGTSAVRRGPRCRTRAECGSLTARPGHRRPQSQRTRLLTWCTRTPGAPCGRRTAGAPPTWRPWRNELWTARASPAQEGGALRLSLPGVPPHPHPLSRAPQAPTSSTRAFSAARFASSSSRSASSRRSSKSSSVRTSAAAMAPQHSGLEPTSFRSPSQRRRSRGYSRRARDIRLQGAFPGLLPVAKSPPTVPASRQWAFPAAHAEAAGSRRPGPASSRQQRCGTEEPPSALTT